MYIIPIPFIYQKRFGLTSSINGNCSLTFKLWLKVDYLVIRSGSQMRILGKGAGGIQGMAKPILGGFSKMRGRDPSWFPHPFVNVSWTDWSLNKKLWNLICTYLSLALLFISCFWWTFMVLITPLNLPWTLHKLEPKLQVWVKLRGGSPSWPSASGCPHIFAFQEQRFFHLSILFLFLRLLLISCSFVANSFLLFQHVTLLWPGLCQIVTDPPWLDFACARLVPTLATPSQSCKNVPTVPTSRC